MGLTDIILAADEKILDKFQSITNKAAKYGYSKYDLASVCQKTTGVSFFGSFSYLALENSLTSHYSVASVDAVLSLIGVAIYHSSKVYIKKEEQELRQLTSGAASVPEQDRKRLFFGVLGTIVAGFGFDTALGGAVYSSEQLSVLDSSERDLFNMLYFGLYALACYSGASAKYFAGTNMIPPKTKKLHQRLYEGAKAFVVGIVPQKEGKGVTVGVESS